MGKPKEIKLVDGSEGIPSEVNELEKRLERIELRIVKLGLACGLLKLERGK